MDIAITNLDPTQMALDGVVIGVGKLCLDVIRKTLNKDKNTTKARKRRNKNKNSKRRSKNKNSVRKK